MTFKTILVVDDSLTIRQQLADVLIPNGFFVVQGQDGVEGLEQAKAHQVDLFIIDVNMPKMGGLTMLSNLRRMPAYETVPVFVLTTESGARIEEGRAAKATAWILKPFKADALLAAVKKVLGR